MKTSAKDWCEHEFGEADLGDERLNRRLVAVATSMLQRPEASLSQAAERPSAVRAMGRFFDNDRFDYGEILAPHHQRTLDRIEKSKVVLVPQDTTHLNYSSKKATEGLGHVGTSHGVHCQGIMMHSALAVSEDGECLGLLYEKLWTRPKAPVKTKKRAHQNVPFGRKESFKWVEAVRAVDESLEGLSSRPELVFIGDREADIYEHLAEYQETGHRFVVRVNCNRIVKSSEHYLRETLEELAPQGHYSLTLRDETGRIHQAKIELRFGPLSLKAQRRKRGAHERDLPDLDVYGVLAREVDPPAGCQRVEWLLLTNLEVKTTQDALKVVGYYEKRWHIECFHKALKSGFRAEDCRLDDAEKLKKFIAMASVLAARLYWAANLRRTAPDRSAADLLTELEWRLLGLKATGKPITKPPTIKQATTWIAELGGFRHTYKEPGMIVYWRGWRELLTLTAGARLGGRLLGGKDVSYY